MAGSNTSQHKLAELSLQIDEDLANDSYENYFDSKFPSWISVVLLIVGIFGNSLSLFVFSQKSMRQKSTFVYLAVLSVIDIFVIVLGLSDIILISYFKFILRNQSLVICRFHTFLTYTFTHLSSFILAVVSIDRAIATNCIIYSRNFCKPNTAYRVILLAALLAGLINFHSLVFLGNEFYITTNSTNYLNDLSNGTLNYSVQTIKSFECLSVKGTVYDNFLDPYFMWIDLFFYAIFPFFIMMICTIMIAKVLFKSKNRFKKRQENNTISLK